MPSVRRVIGAGASAGGSMPERALEAVAGAALVLPAVSERMVDRHGPDALEMGAGDIAA